MWMETEFNGSSRRRNKPCFSDRSEIEVANCVAHRGMCAQCMQMKGRVQARVRRKKYNIEPDTVSGRYAGVLASLRIYTTWSSSIRLLADIWVVSISYLS